jgi:hypothetical protein
MTKAGHGGPRTRREQRRALAQLRGKAGRRPRQRRMPNRPPVSCFGPAAGGFFGAGLGSRPAMLSPGRARHRRSCCKGRGRGLSLVAVGSPTAPSSSPLAISRRGPDHRVVSEVCETTPDGSARVMMVALPVTVHNAWRYRERSVQLLRTGAHTEGYPGTGMTLRPAFYGARPGFRIATVGDDEREVWSSHLVRRQRP